MTVHRIDLNADVGEGADDAALLPLVSSANIACGGHAGDAASMAACVALCLRHGVAVGAHPSYPDRAGFGRAELGLSPAQIHAVVIAQVNGLRTVAQAAGARLCHVKPHGALYNRAAVDAVAAQAIARAVREVDPALALVGLAGSCLPEAGRALGLRVLEEGFADRRYTAAGLLAPRGLAGALIEDAAEAVAQVLSMVQAQRVRTLDGAWVARRVDTVCLHGDGPHAVAFARRLRTALAEAGIAVGAPA